MGLKMENFSFNIVWVHWKIHFLGEELGKVITKKQYIGGNCLKRGAWAVCRFKGGGLAKESNALYVDY